MKIGKDSIPTLLDIFRSEDPYLQSNVLISFGKMKDLANDPAIVSLLLTSAKHKQGEVRGVAVFALRKIALKNKQALPIFLEGLRDKDENVRLQSVNAIISLGPEARAALPLLKEVLVEDPKLKYMTQKAIDIIEAEPASPKNGTS